MKISFRNILLMILIASATTCIVVYLCEIFRKNEQISITIPTPTETPDGGCKVEGTWFAEKCDPPTPQPTHTPELSTIYRTGKASYYTNEYCNKYNPACITASGEVFDDTAFTCACASWIKLGSLLKVSYQDRSVVFRCNDRGNFESKGRILDLSKASFEALAPLSRGVLSVKVEVLK